MSQSDENHERKAKRKVGDDSDMNASTSSTAAKPIESTTAMDMSGKSDTLDTSGGGAKKPVKKKKKKMKTSPSPSPQKKAKKDPNKPEYPKVGYVRFMNVRRDELRKESPDMHHLDVTKKIGEEWMAMSDEKKQPFLDAAKQDKIRYKMEMKAYNKKLKKADQEVATKSKGKKKAQSKQTKDANTSESAVDDSPKKKKRKIDTSKSTTAIASTSAIENETSKSTSVEGKPTKSKTTSGPSVSPAAKRTTPKPSQPTASSTPPRATAIVNSASAINTPPPTPPRIDTNGVPIFGDIPIFTEKFLEHNRQMETELKKIRKLNSDYEQQNAVLEKHVENVRDGIDKTNADITVLRNENKRLSAYLEALRGKLATQLRNLSIPSEPNGANIDNIDKYMNDLYEMVQNNSHGPASLNKAKDLLRKVDLNIDLQNVKITE